MVARWGESIHVKVLKSVDQSELTQLWNDKMFEKDKLSASTKLINYISKYFTLIILAVSAVTFITWLFIDSSKAFTVFTSVLIVACPCALALAHPFTYGNILRLLSKMGLHLRNIEVLGRIQTVSHIVFDKTGTITDGQKISIEYQGDELDVNEYELIKSTCLHSSHPMSKALVKYLEGVSIKELDFFQEILGKGLYSTSGESSIKLGSDAFIFNLSSSVQSGVFIEINNAYKGRFIFRHNLRDKVDETIAELAERYTLSLLSGDSDVDKDRMVTLFDSNTEMTFNATPKNKFGYIEELQKKSIDVMMIGDGLNDAGALRQSDVGIVISDNVNNFAPSCDGIIDAKAFTRFHVLINFIRVSRQIIYGAFILAFFYNVIGLGFAITGNLSPVVAAILMPLSSISVIAYGLLASSICFKLFVKP